MPPKFGTSGLRGLVVELTHELVSDHVLAFADSCPIGSGVFVGHDLRDSSPDISKAVIAALTGQGIAVTDCGAVATPALALAAMEAGAAAVMITGSHIPADRNGLKFYTPEGEITKAHEAQILSVLGQNRSAPNSTGSRSKHDANPAFVDRYVAAFGANALSGLTVGVYSHSTVGRDMLQTVLTKLGANVKELGRSSSFIPVDTEAVDPDTRQQLRDWAAQGDFDAIVSMDGDGDRPLLTNAAGEVIPGDILGQITSAFLAAEAVVTPVSSNTGVDRGPFKTVERTKIGSPFVISGMEQVGGAVVGYEANGGFLLGFNAMGPAGPIAQLMTRDSVLPIVATLTAARAEGIDSRVALEPARVTAADRLQEVPTDKSKALVAALSADPEPFLSKISGDVAKRDTTDGLRLTLTDGRIVHLRPSGNAPELRLYVEADNQALAQSTLELGLSAFRELI